MAKHFPALPLRKKTQSKGALALPVYDGQKLIGILELFETEPLAIKPDDVWLTFMRSIGTEFSLFIERKEAENIRKELANIIYSSIDAIYTIDPELNIVSWNKAAEILYGWKEAEIKEHSVLELYPADRIEESERLRKIYKEKKGYEHYETQRLRKDKTLIWIDLIYSPVLTASGELIVISQDITKQKEAFLALQQNEEKLRSVIEMTDIWIWEVDLAGKYIYSNRLAKKITGFDPNELTGKEMTELANQKQIKKEIEECIENKRGWKGRIWEMKSKEGYTIWLESNGNPILDEKGNLIGFRGADRNITEQMNMERAKNEFISMISHELRTPLTSILAALGLLEAKEDASPETKELLKLADRNANRLAHIINDILDVEKIQLSKMHLELKPILLVNVIQEAINVTQSSATTDQITLVLGDMLPSVQIIADYNRLLQVLLNFFSNAIKFSSAGGKVMISMEKQGERIRVLMKDWGSGIPSAIQGKIFEKFIQAEGGDMRLKGTGLGLNISKSIVEQMGGTIGFVSEPSKGSTFYFEFPIIKEE